MHRALSFLVTQNFLLILLLIFRQAPLFLRMFCIPFGSVITLQSKAACQLTLLVQEEFSHFNDCYLGRGFHISIPLVASHIEHQRFRSWLRGRRGCQSISYAIRDNTVDSIGDRYFTRGPHPSSWKLRPMSVVSST